MLSEQALKSILKLILDNMKSTGNPLGVPGEACSAWRSHVKTPPSRAGFVYYTGCLYQLAPYIEAFRGALEKLVKRPGLAGIAAGLGGLARAAARLAFKPSRGSLERFNRIPAVIYEGLRRAGVDLVLPERELYSGILLYELGLDEAFADHARLVYEELRRAGGRVVTIDPHTYYALKVAYPEFVDGYDLEVYHYTEVLAERGVGLRGRPGVYAVHDSCYLARHTGILDSVRRAQTLVEGAEYRYPRESGRLTGCCGGPIETLYPRLSSKIAERRASSLTRLSREVVAFCPICMVNLGPHVEKMGGRVLDFSEVAWGGRPA